MFVKMFNLIIVAFIVLLLSSCTGSNQIEPFVVHEVYRTSNARTPNSAISAINNSAIDPTIDPAIDSTIDATTYSTLDSTRDSTGEVSNTSKTDFKNSTILSQSKSFSLALHERAFFEGNEISVVETNGDTATMIVGDHQFQLKEGHNSSFDNLTLRLDAIVTERKEAYGLSTFFLFFEDREKELSLTENNMIIVKGKKSHEVKLDFVGDEVDITGKKAAAIFTVDGERTGLLKENEEYYFKDGTILYIMSIMRSKTPHVIESVHVEFTIISDQ